MSKLKKLGWSPRKTFEECLKEIIEWQTENADWIES
jgi:dTDP-D-glucose 4,6-dehydratase